MGDMVPELESPAAPVLAWAVPGSDVVAVVVDTEPWAAAQQETNFGGRMWQLAQADVYSMALETQGLL